MLIARAFRAYFNNTSGCDSINQLLVITVQMESLRLEGIPTLL